MYAEVCQILFLWIWIVFISAWIPNSSPLTLSLHFASFLELYPAFCACLKLFNNSVAFVWVFLCVAVSILIFYSTISCYCSLPELNSLPSSWSWWPSCYEVTRSTWVSDLVPCLWSSGWRNSHGYFMSFLFSSFTISCCQKSTVWMFSCHVFFQFLILVHSDSS